MKFACALALCMGALLPIQAEIQTVTLRWVAANCNPHCNQLLAQQFHRIPGVASINMNSTAGQMDVRWRPNFPLNFQQINVAFSNVGPSIQDFRVRVRGTVEMNGTQIFLRSIGDNTLFQLLGLPQAQPNQFVQVNSYNPMNFPLNPGMRQQLLQAGSEHRVTVIEGPILAPERSPPWMLIIQNLQFVQTPQEAALQQQQQQATQLPQR
jgi:hypothetical protein